MNGTSVADFDNSQRSMSKASFLHTGTGETSWKRSAKRRHGGGASHEDEKGDLYGDVPTSMRRGHACGRLFDTLELTHPDSVDSRFELQKPGKISCEAVDLSDWDAFALNRGSMRDSDGSQSVSQLPSLTRCQPAPNIQQRNRDALSRKRNCHQTSHAQDEELVTITAYQEITTLRTALKSERDALQRLYIDLEEERCASKTAADEAIAMIMRLQEEKSAVLMEARQYQRVAEEKEYYSQQTIALLKDALVKKEYLFLSLQEQINGCKEMLMRMYSKDVRCQANFLEDASMKDKLLLLESPEVTSSSIAGITDVQYQVTGNRRFHKDDSHQSDALSLRCHYSVIPNGRAINLIENVKDFQSFNAETGCDYLSGANDAQNQTVHSSDNTFWETDRLCISETRNTSANVDGVLRNHFNGDIDLHLHQEDTSVTILDRLRNLEERLDFICHSQIQHCENVKHSGGLCDMEPEHHEWENLPEELYMGKHWYNPPAIEHERKSFSYDKPIMQSSGSEPGKCDDYIRCHHQEDRSLVYEGVKSRIGRKCREWETDTSGAVNGDDVGDSIHDVYEVNEIKQSTSHCDDSLRQTCEEMHGLQAGAVSLDSSQESEEAFMNGRMLYKNNGNCEVDLSKLSVEFSALNVLKSMENSDVGQLKLRLQALEGERVFMKEAIESLRKENMELKLLREIAQQLRELKGDVRKAGGSESPCRLSFLSFLRGCMSFAGIQNSPNTEGIRSCNSLEGRNSVIAANAQQSGGLRLILNRISEEPRSGYVTREYKIRIET